MSVKIIAEIGINHNGNIDVAKKLIDVASIAGCDFVKFQKRNPESCVPEEQKDKIKVTFWGKMTYLEYKNRIEFGKKEYDQINDYCHKKRNQVVCKYMGYRIFGFHGSVYGYNKDTLSAYSKC